MGVMNKIMGYLGLSGEEAYDDYSDQAQAKQDEEYDEPVAMNKKAKNNVVSLQHAKEQIKMVLVEPRSYDEVQEIADHLRSRRPVIVNLQRVNQEQGKRIMDFLYGTIYALNGDIQKVGLNIFMCAPDNVDIQGTISELLMNDDTYPR